MKKEMTIYGVTFEVMRETVDYKITNRAFKGLYDCYAKPSTTKIEIYNDWCDWFLSTGASSLEFGITSRNVNCFTFGGYFTYNDDLYYASITKSHNRLYKVNP